MTKRLFDIFLATVSLSVLSPIILLLAITIFVAMGRPVLFRQIRAGRDGQGFVLSKFRSMRKAFNLDGELLPDHERVTAVGRVLRRYRLDELPEFALIISGDMSFVGPRPLPRDVLEETGVLTARCRVRPGLTGLAQVSGNTLLTNDEKFAIDLYYADHNSLSNDLLIILNTIRTVIAGERRNEPLIQKALQHAYNLNRCSWEH